MLPFTSSQEIFMNQTTTRFALAAAAATLFSLGAAPMAQAADDMSMVHCTGVNSCKGTSECKTAKNDCKGQNSCKGQGWVGKKSAAECTKAGGMVAK
jgi:hypothetical protein